MAAWCTPTPHPPLRGAQYRDQGVTLQLVQERSGNYKPLYRAFPRKDGLSTVPILMQGHPDDVKGGRLISSEVRHVLPTTTPTTARDQTSGPDPDPNPWLDPDPDPAQWLDPDPDSNPGLTPRAVRDQPAQEEPGGQGEGGPLWQRGAG